MWYYRADFSHQSVGCATWTMHPDTNVELGLAVQTATTVEDCKAACVRNTQCTGLDFVPTNPEADRCWLGGPWSGQRNDGTQPGVDHYDLDRACTGKISSFTGGDVTRIFGSEGGVQSRILRNLFSDSR